MKIDIRFDELFAKPIDAVWRAVTDRRILARWLMDNDFEPRVGHKFKLRDPPTSTWRGWVECEVLELDAPRRMVWSWNSGMDGEITTRLTFELRPDRDGTRLTLCHGGEGLPAQGESLHAGWARKIGVLSRVLGPDYARRVAFRASSEQVFKAIATVEGLQGWWTTRVTGSDSPGGELRFEFEGLKEHIIMRVEEATSPSSVRWTCVVHTELDDWDGTQVTFDIAPRGAEGCELSFRHVGLRPSFDCYEMCEDGWEHFLTSLVGYVDRGEGTPFGAEARPKKRGSRTTKTSKGDARDR